MPNKEFLERYPLFKKFKGQIPDTLDSIPRPAIHMHCGTCGAEHTFNMTNQYFELRPYVNYPSKDSNLKLVYLCQSCKSFERVFYIYVSPDLDSVYKTGQYPEWEIKMDKNLEKTLGKHAKNYKKGLVCESQGYGIGAFSYYRRITEEIIDELLDSIYDLIESKDKEAYKTALAKTKATRITQEKIDLVKDLLPSILRPNGYNPLGVLHSELSEGLHAQTDESCLEIAGHIREIITFLVNQIILSKDSAKQFTGSMKALLDKKSQ